MIRFVITHGHRYTIDQLAKEASGGSIASISYDRLIRSRNFPHANYIFTDFDRLSYFDHELAGRIYLQMKEAGLGVMNNPALYKNRYALLRSLHDAGLNDYNAYRADDLSDRMRYPVFVRKIHGHGVPSGNLLHKREEVEKELAEEVATGVPLENLVVIEYVGEELRPGLFRKLSIFKIGPHIVPYICGHQSTWLVKVGEKGIAGEELYQDELRLARENPHADHVRKVFAVAGVDYGRADLGFYRGRLQVFEINTNPTVVIAGEHPSPFRRETQELVWKKLIEAFGAIDIPHGPPVRLPKDKLLKRYRKWYTIFQQSRHVE